MKKLSAYILSGILIYGVIGHLGATGDQKMVAYKGSAEFEKMKTLAGKWEGADPMSKDGGKMTLLYEVTSNGSTVVETLFPGTPHSMVTTYYDKDGVLTMTHYCSMGNRPEMKLKKSSANQIDLDYVPTAGIDVSKDNHMHALTLGFPDANHLTQTWHCYGQGKENHAAVFNLTRAK
jgi:hypothetical protein